MEKSQDVGEQSPPDEAPRSGGPFLIWTLLGVVAGLVVLIAFNMK